ncbi:unnamed protein product, partial [Rotaria magnacalcarata]
STTDKERKLPQTSTSQTTPASTAANEPLDKEVEQKRLEEEMQKRKNRIEQWRAERRTMLGIDKVIQQSAAQIAKGKAWSLEDEGDEEEEDLQNVVISTTDIKRDVAAAREALLSSQADKQREALERAAEAAAIASAACAANAAKLAAEQDDDDPLDKFMETIAKEVKSFRGQNATIVSTKANENNTKGIKQEQTSNNGKASVIKIITKKFRSESAEPTVISSNGTLPTTNGHHTNVSTAKPEPMDTTDLSSAVTSRVSVRSGVAKRAKEKGLIMEQDIDGLEYSSEEETAKPAEELDELLAMSTKKSKAVSY